MARYRKVFSKFWNDPRVRSLSLEEKGIALYVLTAQSNRIGCFVFSQGLATEDLELSPEAFGEAFGNVIETFGWCFDEGSRVLWIPRWWRHNRPANPNVLKGNLKDLDELPDSPLVARFLANVSDLDPSGAELLRTFHQTSVERPPEGSSNQEQEKEKEQKQSQEQSRDRARPKRSRLTTAARDDSGFDVFWSAYPRHENKSAALAAWRRLAPSPELQAAICQALEWQRGLRRWKDDGGRFVPYPASYLNSRRWEDERSSADEDGPRTLAETRTAANREALADFVGRDARE